jgi:transposase
MLDLRAATAYTARLRGEVERQRTMLTLVQPEQRIPADHPIRRIKALADAELARLSRVFAGMYAERGRPSIPPERLLEACLLIALYRVRSERQFCEQLQYNLPFQWFLDLGWDEAGFDASTFTKNKERLLEADVARRFFEGIVARAKAARLLSAEHFTVDGTRIEAWASLKSVRPRGEAPSDRPPPDDPGNPTVDSHGEKRSNATHVSTTDPEAHLARKGKGKEAKLSFSAHVVMENRNGLCVALSVADANPATERTEAVRLFKRLRRRPVAWIPRLRSTPELRRWAPLPPHPRLARRSSSLGSWRACPFGGFGNTPGERLISDIERSRSAAAAMM